MAQVFLGVGSNIERERYISAGLDALHGLFGKLDLSPVYDSPAIGFQGQPFLNMVVAVDTGLSVAELAARLRHIEVEHGRPDSGARPAG
jgi:2-amino-4-hydroxy-6-hydroxymethyldihydropteridine diphosphokinase